MNDQSESQHKKFPWVFVISAGVALIAVGFGVASAARLFLYDETSELQKVKTELRETKRELIRQKVQTELAETRQKEEALITVEELETFWQYVAYFGSQIGHIERLAISEGREEASRYCREDAIPDLQFERKEVFLKEINSPSLIRAEYEMLKRHSAYLGNDPLKINCDLLKVTK